MQISKWCELIDIFLTFLFINEMLFPISINFSTKLLIHYLLKSNIHSYMVFPRASAMIVEKAIQFPMKKNQETKFPPFGLINSQFGSIWHAIDTFQYSADGYTISNLLSCFGYVSFFPSIDKKKREKERLVSLHECQIIVNSCTIRFSCFFNI